MVQKDQEPKDRVPRQVTQKPTQLKPRSIWKRIGDSFKGDNANTVGEYLIFEVIVPTVKNLLFEAGSQGLERAILGDRAGTGRSSNRGYYSYGQNSSFSDSGPRRHQESPPNRSDMIGDVIVPHYVQAEDILSQMVEFIDRYGQVTVGELNQMLGITGQFTDEKFGWTNLQSARVRRVRDGYQVALPRPERLR